MNRPDDWNAWLDQHGAALLLLARQWLPTHADAEDAVQDAFVRFWSAGERASRPEAYLFACVRNAAIELLRRQQSARRRDDAVRQSMNACFQSAPTESHAGEPALEVQAALEDLPCEQREVVVMKLWAELTFEEIAAALEISPNTAASRYRYALNALRTRLRKEASL